MVTQLASLGIYQSQPLIITQILGPSQVTIFVIAYKIIALPVDLSYMATAPFLSAFSEARSRGDWSWIKEAFHKSTKASSMIGLPLLLVIALAAKPLIRIWAGPAAVPDSALVIWMSVYTLISVVMMSAGQMLSGLEKLAPLMLSIVLCAIGVVGFTLVFGRWWGLSGVALGMAISKVLTFMPIQVIAVRRILKHARFEGSSGTAARNSDELASLEA